MSVPFKVKAVYEYKSEEPDDLSFDIGQVITVTEAEDEDWYTGNYTDASGKQLDGIFPRNFVEKYEPAIPSRPARANRKSTVPEAATVEPPSQPEPILASPPQPVEETKVDPSRDVKGVGMADEATSIPPPQRQVSQRSERTTESKATPTKQPPAVAEKPTTSSFRDRIAAFNKTAAPPIAPFKPAGPSQGSSGFVKKAFVAPPPSRNAYVPPPSQAPPQRVYRREEEVSQEADEDAPDHDELARSAPAPAPAPNEDQPKPTSLKDRIAALQQQQLEQAARSAEKKKAKKPPVQRMDSAETLDEAAQVTEAPVSRRDTGDTLGRGSIDSRRAEDVDLTESSYHTSAKDAAETVAVPPPARELLSDTNDADDSGAADEDDVQEISTEEERPKPKAAKSPPTQATDSTRDDDVEMEEEAEDEDPEIRRRRELRERMAKMSGGMGMPGMFNPLGGMPPPARKPRATKEPDPAAEADEREERVRAPPVPIMALPGMATRPKQLESDADMSEADEAAMATPVGTQARDEQEDDYLGQQTKPTARPVPQVPEEQAIPPPPPRETRAAPPIPRVASPTLPPRAVPPPPQPADMDDEDEDHSSLSARPAQVSMDRQSSTRMTLPPGVLPPSAQRSSMEEPGSSTTDKRASRPPPPPVPSTERALPSARAPPPPPPSGQPPSRRATSDLNDPGSPHHGNSDSEDEVTEYDGDYDTDIASSAKHKDALKAHNRDSSIDDEGTFTDDATARQPPGRAVPPPPPPSAPPRDVPPPPPQAVSKSRKSSEAPRGGPPPVPTTRPDDDEYDPYKYSTVGTRSPSITAPLSPPLRSPMQEYENDDLYGSASPPAMRAPPPPPAAGVLPPVPVERAAPPPPPPVERSAPLPPPPTTAPIAPAPASIIAPGGQALEAPRQSLDISRSSTVRRSMEVPRPSADYGFIASDIDLGESTGWWTHENTVPPSLQGRNDVLYEIESNTTSKRGGKTTITRDVYVLWMDYSQTTINASFDPSDPNHPSFQQSHERPPPPPRQDQLESASDQLGAQISNAAQAAQGNSVGDGSSHSFVYDLLQALSATVLMPVGMRSYGALVYANLANASTQQHDAIRPGDIVTFRNARFSGHKGGLHTKYSMDVGKPDHAAVVIDWDGTKKKIRAWEQGREDSSSKSKKSKVKEESFRIGDLKSGEVRVWRVMPRAWVGWDKS